MVGMAADIVVMSEDLFTMPVQRFSSIKVELTYIDGELVYSNSND